MLREKITGMLLAGAVGDAWGFPVETWTPERILQMAPCGVDRYLDPVGHKWFTPENHPAGSITDDTQFTIATMKGLIEGHKQASLGVAGYEPYMDAIAKATVESMAQSDLGSGKSTKEAVARLAAGIHWRESGKTDIPMRGTGNGVPMKIAALAAWRATPIGKTYASVFDQFCVDFSAMTHYSQMSALGGLVHANCVLYCLETSPDQFSFQHFSDILIDRLWDNLDVVEPKGSRKVYETSHLNKTPDDISKVMFEAVNGVQWEPRKPMNPEEIRKAFGGGSCYLYDSLPFAYAFFLRDPFSMKPMEECINQGGDTDTNAKIVGDLVGALNGTSILSLWMINGLRCYNQLIELANEFCDTFGVP